VPVIWLDSLVRIV